MIISNKVCSSKHNILFKLDQLEVNKVKIWSLIIYPMLEDYKNMGSKT